MYRFTLPIFVVVVALLVGCKQGQPPPAKPFLVKTNDGIHHEFYRDLTLDAFLKLLPTASVDSVNLEFDQGPQVFVHVKVPEQPGKELTKLRFETSFKTQDGQVIKKNWTAARNRKSGSTAAVFCVPLSVVDGETNVVDNVD